MHVPCDTPAHHAPPHAPPPTPPYPYPTHKPVLLGSGLGRMPARPRTARAPRRPIPAPSRRCLLLLHALGQEPPAGVPHGRGVTRDDLHHLCDTKRAREAWRGHQRPPPHGQSWGQRGWRPPGAVAGASHGCGPGPPLQQARHLFRAHHHPGQDHTQRGAWRGGMGRGEVRVEGLQVGV